jgi:hypothetical protein
MVGVRRLHKRRQVFTTYLRSPHTRSTESIIRELNHQTARARERDYEPTPDVNKLEPLLPPPRAAVAISQNAPYQIREGFPALGPIEGCAASIVIGAPRVAPRGDLLDWLLPDRSPHATDPRYLVHLGCVFDHRIWDGAECGTFLSAVGRWLESA